MPLSHPLIQTNKHNVQVALGAAAACSLPLQPCSTLADPVPVLSPLKLQLPWMLGATEQQLLPWARTTVVLGPPRRTAPTGP